MKLFTVIILVCLACFNLTGQDRSSELYTTLKKHDSLLFNTGFNTCNMSVFEKLVSDTFEFYHDQAGIIHSRSAFIASIRDGLCKLPYKASRRLIDSTLEVFPLKKNGVIYGAVQSGIHRFYSDEAGKTGTLTSTARFIHLWIIRNGE